MIAFTIVGEPVPWSRAGTAGGRRYTPARQVNFMAVVRAAAGEAMGGKPPLVGPVELRIDATYLRPRSMTKRVAASAAGTWKATKPDGSNLQKIVEDALNKLAFHDDAQVARWSGSKTYGPQAELRVVILPIGEVA